MARTHTFKGSASAGYGYFAYIEEGQLVIGEDWGREGGILYRGSYRDAKSYLNMLKKNAPKLYGSITKFFDERMTEESEEETITHQFEDSRDCYGYGYFGFIENGELVICHEAPREGGVLYRGTYEGATKSMLEIKRCDQRLYNSITKYFANNPEPSTGIKTGFINTNQTDLIKVRIKTTDGCAYDCMVKGTTEIDVTDLFTPKNNKHFIIVRTCTNQRVAININEVTAIEFLEV